LAASSTRPVALRARIRSCRVAPWSLLSVAAAEPYNDAGPAVIQIHVEGILKSLPEHAKTKDFHDDATGFIVSPDGLVMTAGHVVPDPNEFEDGTLTVEGRFPHDIRGALKAEDPPSLLKSV
jgi:S1-C subfamily serine protease